MMVINGSPQPSVMPLNIGKKYKLRVINITPDGTGMRIRLVRRDGTPVQWRAVAKDGADLPPSQAILKDASQLTTVGETYEFEYETAKPDELTFEASMGDVKMRVSQILLFQ